MLKKSSTKAEIGKRKTKLSQGTGGRYISWQCKEREQMIALEKTPIGCPD